MESGGNTALLYSHTDTAVGAYIICFSVLFALKDAQGGGVEPGVLFVWRRCGRRQRRLADRVAAQRHSFFGPDHISGPAHIPKRRGVERSLRAHRLRRVSGFASFPGAVAAKRRRLVRLLRQLG